ncbi:hypothetical protein BXT86_02720 [candidate division WOR-3 bacterium 4484_100]|uniref:Uncharacterized protein n=1 Tax=candidate division WOR-3 bacterium 4484_100 TaxID=1936077 RepID=A0A1V4QFN2_UNCW3|nr:MAG: hypothetical protein BXT86_02720 [candidate division WOR-3 bacterium 4484_100]
MEEPRVYLIFDRISPQLRGLLSALLIATAFFLQLDSKNILVGIPFIVGCLVLNLMKGIRIKRVTAQKSEWREVTPAKIEQVIDQCQRIKKFTTFGIGAIITYIIFIFFLLTFGFPLLTLLAIPFPLIATFFNAFILFSGLIFTGQRRAWMPVGLDIKARIVKRMMESPILRAPSLKAIPFLEIGIHKDGSFPQDARILIKFLDAPKEFIGLQGQISLNTVGARKYPYFYVVMIAQPEFGLLKKFKAPSIKKLVIEKKGGGEVDVVVIRQHTTKRTGYYTNEAVQDYILAQGIRLCRSVLEQSK